MDYRQARTKMQRGEFQPLYLFCGSDGFLKEKMLDYLLQQLEKKTGRSFYLERVDGQEVELGELLQSFHQVTIFSQGRVVWVSGTPYFSSSTSRGAEEKGQKKGSGKDKEIEQELISLARGREKDLVVIFSVGNVDRRKKMVKSMEKAGMLVEFPAPKGSALADWARGELEREGKSIDQEALTLLTERVGEDLSLLRNELDKVVLYLGAESHVTADVVRRLVPESSQGNIFNLVGAIGKKNVSDAFVHLSRMRQQNEHPMVILAMVARQFRLLYQALQLKEQGVPPRHISSQLKLPFFAVQELLAQVDLYTESALAKTLSLLKTIDYEIKTGRRDAADALEYLVLKLTTET